MDEPLSPREALELATRDTDVVGPFGSLPVVVVDLDATADAQLLARCADALRARPCVSVGVARRAADHPIAPDLDVLVSGDPPGAAPQPWVDAGGPIDTASSTIAEAVRRTPGPAIALVQLLRAGRAATLDDALTAESWVYAMLQAGPDHARWLATATRPAAEHPSDARRTVRVERNADRLDITLDRPEVRNAYSAQMRDELVEALSLAAIDSSIRCVHLRGSGSVFCAGGDLAEFGTVPDPVTGHLVRSARHAGRSIAQVADRTTVHVHGAAIGGGIELASFAHRVEAAPGTTFRLPELSMGLIPGAGGTVSIARRIGRHRLAWWALTDATVDAATALRWGLVDAIGPAGD